MEKEIFKQLPNELNNYMVSNYGTIKSMKTGKLLSGHKDYLGYKKVFLTLTNNQGKGFFVHRLVALMFVPNPYFYSEINHIDGNKENNYFENLEWCTRSHNVKHAFDMGLKANKKGSESLLAKSFYQFDLKGNLIKKWGSLMDCANFLGKTEEEVSVIRKNLTATLHNRHKSCCGFIFSFEPIVNAEDYIWDSCKNPIIAIDKITGETIEFLNLHEAERTVLPNGKKPQATIICKVCKGKRPSHAGYIWKYKNKN